MVMKEMMTTISNADVADNGDDDEDDDNDA